jgi:hypothetical protein
MASSRRCKQARPDPVARVKRPLVFPAGVFYFIRRDNPPRLQKNDQNRAGIDGQEATRPSIEKFDSRLSIISL